MALSQPAVAAWRPWRARPVLVFASLALLASGCASTAPQPPPQELPLPPRAVPEEAPAEPEAVDPPQDSAPGEQPTPEDIPQLALNPAVLVLASQADLAYQAGDWDQAVATLQRALRISPGEALLWSRLAAVRYRQGEDTLAMELARKAIDLAGDRPTLQAANWRLVGAAGARSDNVEVMDEARQALSELDLTPSSPLDAAYGPQGASGAGGGP